jgi:TonB-dependent SusC/RagA subfamily outer membrane receptor
MRTRLGQAAKRWLVAAAAATAWSLVSSPALLKAQGGGTVVGRVTDARTELPVPGATVSIEGLQIGGLTGADGRYRIANVPAGSQTVVAQSLGFTTARQSVTVSAGAQATANLALQIAPIPLEQIVVSGIAGGERLKTIGNSVTKVDAIEAVALGAPPTISTLLNARAPGLVINFATGRLGAGQTINIRGRTSINLGNSPLVYLDGVRINNEQGSGTGPQTSGGFSGQGAAVAGRLNDISPEDIESIEVIKGPAAATIYGTEASAGVIQIITKKGIAGTRPVFTLQLEQGSLWFRDAEGRIPTNYMRDPADATRIVPWNAVRQEDSLGTPLFRRGGSTGIQGSVSGGFDQARYYLSTSYDDEEGVEANNTLKQFSMHANVNVIANSKLDLATSLHFVDRRGRLGTDAGASTMYGANYGHRFLTSAAARGFTPGIAPEVIWEIWDNKENIKRFTTSNTVNHRPTEWLSQRLNVGLDFTGDDSRNLERFASPDLIAKAPFIAAGASGRIGQFLRQNTTFSVDYSGSARANITSAISASTSLGLQAFRIEQSSSQLGGLGFAGPGVETVSATATPLPALQTQSLNTTVGAYLQEKVAWRDRLFLTGALRIDNNSAFGEDYKWVKYPKADLAWVISEEPFWKWSDVVNTLRLRTAYGESGRAPNTFSALRLFNPVQGPGGTSAVTPGSQGNPNLRPERGKEWEMGFEAEILRRVSLDFTYYDKKVVDQIINKAVAPSSGFPGNIPLNLGRVDNSGIEMRATVRALDRANLQWEVTGTLATNNDAIRDLGSAAAQVTAANTQNVVGYPVQGWWSRRIFSADRDATTGLAINVLCADSSGRAGVPCATAPFHFIGPSAPTSSGSLTSTMTVLKQLRLYALLDFQRGNVQFNANELVRCTSAVGVPLCEANYYPQKYSPIYMAAATALARQQNVYDQYIQDASYVKLREVSASYRLPERWLRGVSDTSITLAARELAIWTKYRGLDPDFSNVTDQAIVPQLSRISAILNVRF